MAAGEMVQLAASAVADELDTTDNLNMFSGLQKAFVVNGAKLKIVDFSNTKITLNSALTRVPTRGTILTGADSGATMSVDFINAAKTIIYGYTLSGTFAVNAELEVITGGGTLPATRLATAVAEASDTPHWYDWVTYPDAYNTSTGATESYGSLPAKVYLGAWYRGRAILSGNPNDPHQWYMSRQLDPFDFAYIANDAQSPVAGTNSDAGKVGDIVRALIPFHDDYMIFGCASSMHYLQGDPAAGGELHSIDDFSGIFGAQSWCFDKIGNLYLFGADGVSRVKRGSVFVENLSVITLPKLLENEAADPTTHRIVLGYDKRRDGISIAITKLSDGSNSNYFYDIKGEGFFPETYPDQCGAYSMIYYPANSETNADLLLGCTDGYIRHFDDSSKDDDGGEANVPISSNVLMPIQDLNPEDDEGQGKLNSTTVELSEGTSGGNPSDSDGVTLDVHVRDSAQKLVEAVKDGDTPLITRTFSGTGRQKRIRKKARGKWLGVVLKNSTAAESWSLSKLSIISKIAGRIKR